MKLIATVQEMKELVKGYQKEGKTIGLVPTMGYLHEGHLSLIKRAKEENDVVIVSDFVNPTQFGPNEDFDKYPRDLEKDIKSMEPYAVDVVFHPTKEEMYPQGFNMYVDTLSPITKGLCGKTRPTHFRGVMTVVHKLFQITEPDRAYFGQKDAQQVAVIKNMVNDLFMNVTIVPCPIVREEDGLARSSRNIFLSPEERKQALSLSESLFLAKDAVLQGETNAETIKQLILNHIQAKPLANIDYVEIVDNDTLEPLQEIKGNVLVALAVKFGETRLIDNITLEVK